MSLNSIKISVIIPFYKGKKWLKEAIDSVLNQTYSNLEIIVINDGSIEDISDLEIRYKQKVCFIKVQNGGAGSARNIGINNSTGTYVAFLDSDDLWLKTKIEQAEYGIPSTDELDAATRDLIEQIIRRTLYEKRYSDAVAGQLYKLHTGQTVEGISRLVRVSELETGFGTGLAGTGTPTLQPSKEFLKKWPKESKALGERPIEEFAARTNELMRFVIQKGMDVKKSGEKPVAGELVQHLTKGKKGVTELWQKILSEESYKELKEFKDSNEKAIKMRLGTLPTDQIRKELSTLHAARGRFEFHP
jgi:glycosyltransferase involved in cell wall biosynthesis